MRTATITVDVVALGALVGSALRVMPAIAGLLAVAYYAFVIYDRVKYGPEASWGRRIKDANPSD